MTRILLALLLTALPALARAACPVGKKVLLDNGQAGYSETGDSWNTWPSNQQSIGVDYRYLSKYVGAPGAKGKARWQPSLPVAGQWKVEATFRATENRSSDADYFVHAGDGKVKHTSVDQRDGCQSGQPSHGPVYADLGTHWFGPGQGYVELDGTDDSQSDEADAVQWTLVSCTEGAEPPPPPPCGAASPAVGHAVSVTAAAGWESEAAAQGAPDEQHAFNPNLESGEALQASGFDVCDPEGAETITGVSVGVRTKVQYASGNYAVVLKLASAGVTKTFAHEALLWDDVDVTATKGAWTWADVKALGAKLSLHDHPGGAIDSDVWVDAFRVTVTFTTCAPNAAKACIDGQIRWMDACGAVGGVADACDDGDPCTGDGCLGEQCTHVPTGADGCGGGCTPRASQGCHASSVVWLDSCGTPTEVVMSCDDGDPCTEDLCVPGGTCSHEPVAAAECAACAPRAGTACVGGDVRWLDGCGAAGGVAVACDDGDPCTDDGCEGASCTHAPTGREGCAACDRTPSIVCEAGVLVRLDACGRAVGVSSACADFDPCTRDGCDPATLACTHEALEPEACGGGGARPGTGGGAGGGTGGGSGTGDAGTGGAGTGDAATGGASPGDTAGGFASQADDGAPDEAQTHTWTEGCGAGPGRAGAGALLLLALSLLRRRNRERPRPA